MKTITPTDASIILTYRCPMRCVMCNIWKNPTDKKEEIKAEDLKSLPKLKFISKIPSLFKGTILSYKDDVAHTRGKVIEITASPDSYMEVDGESVGNTPVRIELIPSAINVVSNL